MAKSLEELKQEISQVSELLAAADSDSAAFSGSLTSTQTLKVTAEASRLAAVDASKEIIADFTDFVASSSPVVITDS